MRFLFLKNWPVWLAGLLLWMSCTGSPIGGDGITQDNRQISGKLILSDGQNPDDIVVWLEKFDISERTDASGDFQLILPPPGSQGPAQGTNGSFNLYFYMANYYLASTHVATRDGEFIHGQGEFDNNGQLAKPKKLEKFLKVETTVFPSSVPADFDSNITVEVKLQATIDSTTTQLDTVTVVFRRASDPISGRVFLKRLGSNQVFVVPTFVSGQKRVDQVVVRKEPQVHRFQFTLAEANLPAGNYDVIPYVLVRHQTVPQGLLNSLGEDVETPGLEYLKLPFKRDPGHFVIQE